MTSSPGIELRHLRYFLAVYDELHFGHAAEKLHIAQPPLSQAIRKLEKELGVQLLERTSRTVRPTVAGRVFAERARDVLARFEFGVAETRRIELSNPPVRVGCVTYLPTRRLQSFLTALKRRETSLRTEVTHMLALEQVERLLTGELDVGVLACSDDFEGLEWERVFPGEGLRLFVGRGHPLAEQRIVSPADLSGETLITYPRTVNPAFYDGFMRQLDEAGYRFARRHETNADPRDAFMAVAGGLGVLIAPISFEESSLVGAGELAGLPMDPPLSYPDTIVAWRADPPAHLSSRLRSIREAAAELFRATSPHVTASATRAH